MLSIFSASAVEINDKNDIKFIVRQMSNRQETWRVSNDVAHIRRDVIRDSSCRGRVRAFHITRRIRAT